MVPFGRNPKSALSEQRSSDQQMGGEQQDECRPRGAENVNGSVHVHCCFVFYVNIPFISNYFRTFAPGNPNMLGL